LRDYGEETVTIWDAEEGCEHEWISEIKKWHGDRGDGNHKEIYDDTFQTQGSQHAFCQKCGAWRGQLGLEPSLDLYLRHLLQVTAELKRVLKPSGVMFWNHGDSYGGSGGSGGDYNEGGLREGQPRVGKSGIGIIPKCLAMQNYRLIQKMVDEQGWILRNIIPWVKPNHMPSSVKDRFTNGYEPIFMLTKNKKYWFDLDAVREPHVAPLHNPGNKNRVALTHHFDEPNRICGTEAGKNPGDVWTIPTQPFPDAHFAVFPEAIPERAIKCSCPAEICTECGKARVRITERIGELVLQYGVASKEVQMQNRTYRGIKPSRIYENRGWTTCSCGKEFRPGIVLDPFLGSGTTMKKARERGMSCIGIDISQKYIEMSKKEVGWNEGLFGIEFHEIKA